MLLAQLSFEEREHQLRPLSNRLAHCNSAKRLGSRGSRDSSWDLGHCCGCPPGALQGLRECLRAPGTKEIGGATPQKPIEAAPTGPRRVCFKFCPSRESKDDTLTVVSSGLVNLLWCLIAAAGIRTPTLLRSSRRSFLPFLFWLLGATGPVGLDPSLSSYRGVFLLWVCYCSSGSRDIREVRLP